MDEGFVFFSCERAYTAEREVLGFK
jgi:hypothetical protein